MNETEFDKFAEEYKALHQSVLGASGEDTEFFADYKVKDTATLVEACDYPEELAIMDFGSGTGGSVSFFLKYFPKCQLTCLDVSRKSLEMGKERHEEKVEFTHFDGEKIPFEDNTYHVVFAACVFHHIPVKLHRRLIKDIQRILKPGGMFIVFEHNPHNFITVKAVNACSFDENAILIPGSQFRSLLSKNGWVDSRLRKVSTSNGQSFQR